jgi:hypothetical protein
MPANQVLKNFNLFVDGRGYAGQVEDVNLPKLSIKTEDWRGGGMDGTLALDMGMEKLEASFTLLSYDRDVLNLWGILPGQETALVMRGALEDVGGLVTPVVHVMRCRLREIDPGTNKAGDKPALKITADVHYYQCVHGGISVIEIDVVNMIRRIGQVDRLAAIRAAIGV